MSEDKVTIDQYGRRSWNIAAYEKEAKQRRKQPEDNESGIKIDTKSSQSYLEHRDEILKESLSAVKLYNLINPANSTSTFGSNKRFGFFCPICNLSFRDNLALIDHFNSPQHISKVQELGNKDGDDKGEELESGVKRASLKEVISVVEKLVADSIKARNNSSENISFEEGVTRRREFEAKRREKRKLRKVRSRTRKAESNPSDPDPNISSAMGFSGFGSTKLS